MDFMCNTAITNTRSSEAGVHGSDVYLGAFNKRTLDVLTLVKLLKD